MERIPQHVAIIMDGNGRWAKEHGLSRAEGHWRGADSIERIVRACRDRNIRYLTLYGFSEENWNRPSDEVSALMHLMSSFLSEKRDEMVNEGTRFKAIGDIAKLAPPVREEIQKTESVTSDGKRITLIVALSYGGRQEICRAVNKLNQASKLPLTPESISGALDTAGIPDPDLLIRTSGEYRISNFLLWQGAYAELYFTETLWPDFGEKDLDLAIASYARRKRRFGMTDEQLHEDMGVKS